MAVMSHLITTAVMALAIVASPIIADKSSGADADAACDYICSNSKSYFENTICYGVSREDGSCYAVWLNAAMAKLNVDGEQANTTTIRTRQASDSDLAGKFPVISREDHGVDHLLIKRAFFTGTSKPERICHEYSAPTCFHRNRGAEVKDCAELGRFWYHHHGHWTFDKTELANRHWMNVMNTKGCVYAIGNPQAAAADGKTRLGNEDIYNTIIAGVNECDRNGEKMESQGVMDCKDWPLHYWVTSLDKFNCCSGEKPPGVD